MRDWDFSLVPFAPSSRDLQFTLHVSLDREVVRLKYRLTGSAVGEIKRAQGLGGTRRDELWRSTCFEFFIAKPGRPQYFEINMAPNRDWNAYSFSGVREGMRNVDGIKRSPVEDCRDAAGAMELSATVRLSDFPLASPVELSATAVLEYLDGSKDYWALSHVGEKPDFHLRRSFTALLRD